MYSERIWTLYARKLAGEISTEESAELEMLLKEDSGAHPKVQTIEEFWNSYNGPPDTASSTEETYQRLSERLVTEGFPLHKDEESDLHYSPSQGSGKRSGMLLFMLAFFLIAGAGTIFYYFENRSPRLIDTTASINTISTKFGSRTKIELPDGSVVWLNAGSRLTYDKQFDVAVREVNLVGEGFFDVVHKEDKPFIIHTLFFDIKDLGTQFNVKCYPDDKTTETSLVQGSVEITVKKRPLEKYILKPDEKLVLLNQDYVHDSVQNNLSKHAGHLQAEPLIAIKKLSYLPQDSFSVETAWTYNKLSFDDEPFSEVAKKIGRWYNMQIEFRNKKLEDIHLTVSFINESFEQVMEALKYTNRFNYDTQEGKVIIF